jgi:hypothetical protein
MEKLNRIALLIDADNVSIDVTRQVLQRLEVPGARLQHRRAYGSVNKALEFADLCRDHAIRFLPSTFAGPNATDIAMAIDAVELVLRQPVDEVVIVSSDMDYSPLIVRLRELGCRVTGYGQQGKSGRDIERDYERVYDQFEVIGPSSAARPRAGGRAAAKTAAPRGLAASRTQHDAHEPREVREPTAMALVAPTAPLPGGRARRPALRAVLPPPVLASAPLAAAVAAAAAPLATSAAPRRKPAPKMAPAAVDAAAATSSRGLPGAVEAVLDACPDLRSGMSVRLNGVAVALRERGLLTKSGKTSAFFKKLESHFALLPVDKPESVCFLGAEFNGG